MSTRKAGEVDGYNGWTNRETWLVALWIGNDEGTQAECADAASRALADAPEHENVPHCWSVEQAARFALASWLEEYVCKLPEMVAVAERASFVSDLVRYALGGVDWDEIADSLIAEVAK